VKRQRRHFTTLLGQFSRDIRRSQALEQICRSMPRRCGRFVDPSKIRRRDAHCQQLQQQTRQLASSELRSVAFNPADQVFSRIQPDHAARSEAPGTSRPLCCRGLADPHHFEGRQTGPRRISSDASQPGIDHRPYAFNRQRAFGNVRRQDDFAPGSWLHRPVLFLGR
jgi:hypothetical protein